MADEPNNIILRCAARLALTSGELLTIARTAPRRYFVWSIPKRSGKGDRIVCHPSRELKPIQEFFLDEILTGLPIHPAATAYVKGSSIKRNAEAHMSSRVILKLDFSNFFNSLTIDNWIMYTKDHFPTWNDLEIGFSGRVLFWGNGSYIPQCLAIGAPTSPMLSNALLFDIDVKLFAYAKRRKLVYTRYADDITFSSKGMIDRDIVTKYVRKALQHAKYTSIQLNEDKTLLASKKSARIVTGLVITNENKISLGRDRKRLISAMVHYASLGKITQQQLETLAGLLAFSKDVEPSFITRLGEKYSIEFVEGIMRQRL